MLKRPVLLLAITLTLLVITITSAFANNLQPGNRTELSGNITIRILNGDEPVLERNLPGLTVWIPSQTVITDENGYYHFTNVQQGNIPIRVFFGEKKIYEDKVDLLKGERVSKNIVVDVPLEQVQANMNPASSSGNGITIQYHDLACRDYNGPWGSNDPHDFDNLLGFPGSVCDLSLGTRTECWPEVFGEGKRYCDGTKNCGLLVGHSQIWHKHTYFYGPPY